jgi:hypothetical protein
VSNTVQLSRNNKTVKIASKLIFVDIFPFILYTPLIYKVYRKED